MLSSLLTRGQKSSTFKPLETMNVFNVILDGNCNEQSDALEYALGFDFGSCDTTHNESIAFLNYVDTVNGVDVYYCYGTDSYLFVDSE